MLVEELIQTLSGMDPTEAAWGVAFVLTVVLLLVIGGIVWYFVSAMGYRKMFLKAGEAGWKAFVPCYNNFICFQFAWNTKVFWLFLASLILMRVLPDQGGVVAVLCQGALVLFRFVLDVKLRIRIARSFGKSTVWGVLLFFFPFVISLILGYGKAEYIGNTTVETKEESDVEVGV